jgi:Peptidase M50B-like
VTTMPAPSLSTMLGRIGQTQASLSATTAVLLGIAVLAVVLLPATWLLAQHIDTMAHEGTHALVGSSTGGKISGVRVQLDGDGGTKVSTAGVGGVITGAAGYLGSSAFGLGAAKLISVGHIVAVLWLSLLLLGILLPMIRNPFGAFVIVATGIVIYAVVRNASIGTETVAAYLITWLLLLSGVRVVVQHGPGAKDAGILASSTHIPRVLWCGLWLVGTTVALVLGGSLLV